MSSSDLHEATFKWPHTEPSEVIVTGSFDSWSRTIHLSRTPTGFAGVVKIPWGQKVTYKYIVDGRWTTTDTQPTELDPIGNINNTYNAPARPIQPKADAPPAVLAAPAVTAASAEPAAIVPTPVEPVPIEPAPVEPVPVQLDIETVGKANGVIASAKEAATAMVEAIAPGTTETPAETPIEETKTEPPIIESTTAAAKGASTTVTETTSSYVTAAVASVAAAVQAVSGAVAKEEPVKDEEVAPVTEPEPASPESVLPTASEPVAPVVPVAVLPLTANSDVPATNGDEGSKIPDATVVEGAVTSEEVPVAHEASTHGPVIVNGKATSFEPEVVALPPVTPSELPVTPTPAANGDSKAAVDVPEPAAPATPTPAATSPAPPSTPPAPASPNGHAKEKRMNFPTLGRHHRHSSSAASATSDHSETSSANNSLPSRKNSQRKQRKSSFFGKIKEIFHHDHKEKVEKEK